MGLPRIPGAPGFQLIQQAEHQGEQVRASDYFYFEGATAPLLELELLIFFFDKNMGLQ